VCVSVPVGVRVFAGERLRDRTVEKTVTACRAAAGQSGGGSEEERREGKGLCQEDVRLMAGVGRQVLKRGKDEMPVTSTTEMCGG
jgi:hypothetical protein